MKRVGISIVIPCFNETRGMAHLVSKLKELEEKITEPHELIFVDDGSSDSTHEKLIYFYKERVDNDVRILKHPVNRGLGAAMKTGVSNANGHYIAVIDSDCTYEPIYLLPMLDMIKKEKADIITASPYHPQGTTVDVPGYRLFLSRNLSNIYNVISKSHLYTYTSIFRIYRRETISNVTFESDGFLAMAEILIKAHEKGFKIIEYPVALTARRFGTSNANILNLIKEHLCFIIRILLKKGRI